MEQTITDVNLFLRLTRRFWHFKNSTDVSIIRPWAVCKDGFTVSIQASSRHYCRPRIDETDHYYYVELGYPSERVESWMEYADGVDNEYETVYACVPVEIVNKVLEAHGGIVDIQKYNLPEY